MFLEQFQYEIRHLSGIQNEISDGLSRLHLRNLTLTAPTNAEAEAERTKGIIAPSTHVVGVSEPVEPLIDENDRDDEDDTNGEGGSDEALFQVMQGGFSDEIFEAELTVEASSRAEEAEWLELEDKEEGSATDREGRCCKSRARGHLRKGSQAAKVGREEEKRRPEPRTVGS